MIYLKRLKKANFNDTEDAMKLLQRVESGVELLRDTYYILFDNLNALYEKYPMLYKKLEMSIKLPKNEDAKNVAELYDNFEEVKRFLFDREYLNEYINPER